MIKIIRGVYGYCGDNGIIIPKTSKDKPFSLSPEDEKRLVDQKVAVYVDDEAETPEKADTSVGSEEADTSVGSEEADTSVGSEETGVKEESKQDSKKSTKKKAKNKKDAVDEEPPAFDAVDPE